MKLTYVRWSMTIIETEGLTIITDPVFRMLGIHQTPKAYTIDRMPRPDLVFISHTHLDHFAPSVLKRIPASTPVWMPAGKVHRASRLGLTALRGVEAWEEDKVRGVHLTAVPARHTGGELGLIIEGDRTAYFAGDTGLDEELFHKIGQRWPLDAVLLPIGQLKALGIPVGHIGPKQAPRALQLLGEPHVVVPTHYSGMSLAPLVAFGGTPRKLSQSVRKAGLGTLVGTTRPMETATI
jgi:L-ascorbate metabolism protein UlaG (beta-lactamase superfamily)